MPDLLFELFSEEIPARMQAKAAEDLQKLVTGKLVDAGLVYEGARAFATPRRLALTVQGIPARQPDLKEEKKGPRVGAPEGAVAGFLKAASLKSLDEATIQKDKKGDFYVALIEKPGRDAIDVLKEILPLVVRTFPWPKSMRWGERSARPGALNWVRPLHSIVATFGIEHEEPEIVHFSIDGIDAGLMTYGHRFLAPDPISVRRFSDYVAKLEKAKVVLDPARRRDIIRTDAKNLAFAQGFEVIEDEGLLAEVAGLVEWPVVLMGSFEEAFLKIPQEVIRTTIRANQKCFVVRKPGATPFETRPAAAPQGEAVRSPHPEEARSAVSKDGGGQLANKFILVSNIEATDGGKAIVAGNERVIRARLSDAKFFYETDLKTKLEDRLKKFDQIVFHEKLGTQAERIARIERLAAELAPLVGADIEKTKRAAKLCKADLLTEVVGEFPELQGLMGKYYALAQGEDESVAAASEDHYKPAGPADRVPTDPVSVAVALADKLDTLIAFWAIDEKPTGSKDPFALRRAALGVIRLIVENNLRVNLLTIIRLRNSLFVFREWMKSENVEKIMALANDEGLTHEVFPIVEAAYQKKLEAFRQWDSNSNSEVIRDQEKHAELRELVRSRSADLISFFADRLKVQLREQGARHDLVDAVFALEGQDDLLMIVRRVDALGKFLDTDDGKNLLAGVKRASNILRIEEKKDSVAYDSAPDAKLYKQDEEKALAAAIAQAKDNAGKAVAKEDFAAAMSAMAKLRPHVDAFFDKVTVNVTDGADAKGVRANRLRLLSEIREATRAVADFSKIEG